ELPVPTSVHLSDCSGSRRIRSISSRSCCHPEPKRVCLTNATKELVLLSGANTRGAAVVGLISDLYRCLKQDVPVTLADSEVSALSSLVEAAHTEHLVYFLYPDTESLADRVPHVPNGLSTFRGLRPVTGGGSWSCLRELVPKHVQRLAVGLQQSGHALRVPELVSQRHGRLRGVVVASGLPDGRQHLMDNPALELPCPLLPGAEDQGVQTGLVDHGNLLVTARGAQAQRVAHALGHEPRLSVPLDDAELKPLHLELLHASSFIFCLTIRQAHTGHDVLTEHRSQCSPGFASQFSALMPSFTEWK